MKKVKEEEEEEELAEAARDAKRSVKSTESGEAKESGAEEEDEDDDEEIAIEDVSKRTVSPAESEFELEEYDQMLGPFNDFSELIVQCVGVRVLELPESAPHEFLCE